MRQLMLKGACLCGAVQCRVSAQPRVHYCHCSMCQKATGSAAAVLAWVPRDQVAWQGAPVRFRSSPIAVRMFCGVCGTPVALAYDGSSEIAVHIALFDDRDDLPPCYHYGVESRLTWFDAGRGLSERVTEEKLENGGSS